MFSSSNKYINVGLLIIRLCFGIVMIVHGLPKLMGGVERWEKLGGSMANLGITFYPVFWGFMAAITETFGGLLLLAGFAFQPVCILLAFTMLVASIRHLAAGDGLAVASHALELCILFVGLMFTGAGAYSLRFSKKPATK